ncbi:MAG TPA: folylpolyglutamate synthase/dihydrofolate synthase family protein [Tepidisphaeraceae bacterium]|nr:folylpolyglutamate synthase/dihydrofolate synthase family protein [Tepidisphaeraceae bacterium]
MPTRTKARRTSSSAKRTHAAPARKPVRVAGRSATRTLSKKRVVSAKSKVIPVVLKPLREPVTGFTKALKYLNTLADFERLRIVRYNNDNFNLERMRLLLKKLGNPHEQFKSVHVAGTKGKGSTCAMIASMLQACGYKVGLYTSPHLVDIRERIQINGEMISTEAFGKLVKMIEPVVARIKPSPTYFDVLTAVAFQYFADQEIDIAIVETGLGGRLDSTNVIKPEVTAITSISKDHMAQLGHTLAKIAAEKAGIFKAGVPAVTVTQDPDAEAVLKEVAAKVGAPLDITGKTIEFSYRFESSRMLGPHNRICLTTPNSKFEHLAVPLMGEHQAINCGLALAVVDRLKGRGFNISDTKAMEGLSKTTVPGRMEMVSQTPRVLVDGAHNAASLDMMLRAVGQHIPYDSMVVIFGCCGDKDVTGMLDRITAGADKVIFTKVDNIRTADPHELSARYVEQYGKMAQVAGSLEEALAIAQRAVTKEDLICITGSFYLVGEAKKYFTAKQAAAAVAAANAPAALTAAGR